MKRFTMPQNPESKKRKPARRKVSAPRFLGRTPANTKMADPKDFPNRDPRFKGRTKDYLSKKVAAK
jgi:hypothetical protein